MTGAPSETNWLTLYREAVLEQDPKTMRVRIAQARDAIRKRAHELWYVGAPDTAERRRIDAACNCLDILCTSERTK
jgi:hypothetical protein